MCEPTTLAIIGGVTTILSSGVSAYGQYKAGQASKQASEYQAQIDAKNSQVASYNAAIAQQNAEQERLTGREQERRQRLKTAQIIGQQKTGMAASGIDISDGTALDIIEDSAMMGEMDALMLRYDAERKAKNYETQAFNFANQADIYQSQSRMNQIAGKNAAKSGLLSSMATGFGGLGKVSDKWYQYKPGSASKSAKKYVDMTMADTSMFA